LLHEIQASQADAPNPKAKHILKCTASEDIGVDALARILIEGQRSSLAMNNRRDPSRLREEAKALLRREWEKGLSQALDKVHDPKSFAALF
jgi:hypothetical protein